MEQQDGPLLLAVMEEHGITQRALAELLGVKPQSITYQLQRLKAGNVSFSALQAIRIADLLTRETGEQWTVEALFGEPAQEATG